MIPPAAWTGFLVGVLAIMFSVIPCLTVILYSRNLSQIPGPRKMARLYCDAQEAQQVQDKISHLHQAWILYTQHRDTNYIIMSRTAEKASLERNTQHR